MSHRKDKMKIGDFLLKEFKCAKEDETKRVLVKILQFLNEEATKELEAFNAGMIKNYPKESKCLSKV